MGYKNHKDGFGRITEYRKLVGAAGLSTSSVAGMAIPNLPGTGIYLEENGQTILGWKDLLGQIIPRTTGAGTPSAAVFRGGVIRQYAFGANDFVDINFHIPHDWVPGTDFYLHTHWGHNGTAISGDFVLEHTISYAKGHNQAIFPAEITNTQTIATTNIATTPQYSHHINETQLSSSTPSASQLDTALIEPDGILMLHTTTTAIPTITGGSPNEPFIFFLDIHYQSTNVTTKNRVPNFWTG